MRNQLQNLDLSTAGKTLMCSDYLADSTAVTPSVPEEKLGSWLVCSLFGCGLRNAPNDASAAAVKKKWRYQQILIQKKFSLTINSTWRKVQITCLWCGVLRKRASHILGIWQARWFELRREPVSPDLSQKFRAVLQYESRGSSGSKATKKLVLLDARSDAYSEDRTCVSVAIAGRTGRMLLAAASERAAGELLSHIAAILRPRQDVHVTPTKT